MKGTLTALPVTLSLLASLYACADPCAGEPDGARAILAIGAGTETTGFVPLDDGQPRELVMGEQGLAMFHHMALKADGLAAHETGRTRLGWWVDAFTPDGESLGTAWSPHVVRETADGYEVLDVRLIPTPPPLRVWDTDVVFKAGATGRCGGQAEAELTLKAVRVGDAG